MAWVWIFSSLIWPMSPFTLCPWFGWCSCHATALFLLWYPLLLFTLLLLGLQAEMPTMLVSDVIPSHHSCQVNSYNILSFPGPFYSLGILGPFHSLGILDPFHSFLLLTFPWALAKSFGLPWPNPTYKFLSFGSSGPFLFSFYFSRFSWAYYFILWSFLGPFAFPGATLLFCKPVEHYSCHSSPMVFILLFSFSTFFILLGFFCHWVLLPKNGHQQYQTWV